VNPELVQVKYKFFVARDAAKNKKIAKEKKEDKGDHPM
jgi:hypothetical protein